MGDKKNIIDLLEDSIMSIERRQGYLKAKLVYEKDKKYRTEIEEEMKLLDQQLSYTIDTKKSVEKELKKAKDKEQKKKIENLLKASYFIGVVRENTRMTLDYDVRLDNDKELIFNSQFDKVVDKIFSSETFRYITKDMVEQIANDEEFKDMWENDQHRLDAKEIELQGEYEHEMDRMISIYGGDKEASFEEKEERFVELMQTKNGFMTGPEKLDAILNSEMGKALDEEDRKFFEDIKAESLEIGLETKKLYEEFARNESDFKKGNGFSKYVFEKEKKLLDKWKAFIDGPFLDKAVKMDQEKAKGYDEYGEIFKASKEFEFPIESQVKRDKVLNDVNELRIRMEMWKVYERLPKGSPVTAKQKKQAMDNEYKSWAKIERIKRVGALTGGLERTISDWAAEGAADALKTAKDFKDAQQSNNVQKAIKKELSDNQKENIKNDLAMMVLREIIEIEKNRPEEEDKSHYKDLVGFKKKKSSQASYEMRERDFYREMAKELAEDPAFTGMFDKFFNSKRFKKADFAEMTIKFIAEDMDKKFAKNLLKEPVLQKTKEGIAAKEAAAEKESEKAQNSINEASSEVKRDMKKN